MRRQQSQRMVSSDNVTWVLLFCFECLLFLQQLEHPFKKEFVFFFILCGDKYTENEYCGPNGLCLFRCYFMFFISITVGPMEITVQRITVAVG